jgi:hypothetical protein
MKKIFAILMTICLMASVLCITAFAAEETLPEPAEGTLLRVTAIKGEDTVLVGDYSNFEDGWNKAMEIAGNAKTMKNEKYERIVVDIYADWTAAEDGNFTDDAWNEKNGDGFNNDTIYIPYGAIVTLNLNGYTINRNLKYHEADGEVMYICENADVIINNGKITGGKSKNGAGGINIKNKANVILNNVHVDGNSVMGDDGAAIAVYDGANLIMNEGSISNNGMRSKTTVFEIDIFPYGALYANEATVMLKNVTLSDNYTFDSAAEGVAVYATQSTVTMDKCIVSGNAVAKEGRYNAKSVIAGYDSKFMITDTDFTNNASNGEKNCYGDSRLFYLEDSRLTMEGGKITQNNPQALFNFYDSDADIKKVTITDNSSVVIYVDNDSEKVNMIECTLNKNTPIHDVADIRVETKGTLAMKDCEIGDTSFEDKDMVEGVGSLIGEGSLTTIAAFLALFISVASVGVFFTLYKKKPVLVTATEQSKDGE